MDIKFRNYFVEIIIKYPLKHFDYTYTPIYLVNWHDRHINIIHYENSIEELAIQKRSLEIQEITLHIQGMQYGIIPTGIWQSLKTKQNMKKASNWDLPIFSQHGLP